MADGFGIGNDLGNNVFDLCRYIGQTVTIFTTSGGVSGLGFTGVLISANDCFVRLIARIGAAPECPVGSNCTGPLRGGFGNGGGCGYGDGYGNGLNSFGNGLGSVVVIPTDRIASFVHNAI
ncbi:MAG: hypothetical protein H7X94_03815 [Vallitaleaceae bacterium]|nr:hypothetical protein [Vallitaleaceae bacterium]